MKMKLPGALLSLLLAVPSSGTAALAAPPPPTVPAAAAAAPAAAPSPPAPTAAAAAQPAKDPADTADLDFLVANLDASDGLVSQALARFEEAEKAHPESAYIHLEHAQLLTRVALANEAGTFQTSMLRQAAAQIDLARRAAPNNLDVLRGVGLVYSELAGVQSDAAAAATALEALKVVHERDPSDVGSALNLGRIYLGQQQAGKAAEAFRDVVERSPNQRAAYALLVEALLRDEKPREAEKVLAQILDFEPAAVEARLTLAELESQRNDYRAELATLKGAPADEQGDVRLQRQMAWAYYLTGDLDQALATLDQLLKSGEDAAPGPNAPTIALEQAESEKGKLVLLKGLVLAAQGHNEEAAELLEKMRASRPADPALANITARVFERAGHPDRAARVMTDLAAALGKQGKAEDERQARLELAQIYFDAKDWDRVNDTLQPLLRLPGNRDKDKEDATREPALLLAADALVQRKSYDEALKLLAKGQTERSSPLLAAKRGEVLSKAGRDRDSARQLDDLAGSRDPLAALAAAEAYQRLERYPESVPILERVLARSGADLQPQSVKAARFLLGAGYERSGKREQAVAEFRRLLDADPDYHAALNYLGYMYAERGENLDEAKTMIEKAVALEPDNGAYVDSLGWVYYRLGRMQDARVALERATRLETADGTVQEHLGDVYGAMGEREQATEAYRHAIQLTDTTDHAKTQELQRKLDNLGGGTRRP
jgi:tetratricopeptide (TPR) repeat protein